MRLIVENNKPFACCVLAWEEPFCEGFVNDDRHWVLWAKPFIKYTTLEQRDSNRLKISRSYSSEFSNRSFAGVIFWLTFDVKVTIYRTFAGNGQIVDYAGGFNTRQGRNFLFN